MNYKIHLANQTLSLSEEFLKNLNYIDLDYENFHIIYSNQSFHASVVETEWNKKCLTIELNGNTYEISIEDEYDQLIHKMGLESGGSQKLGDIYAPMPGLILDILVEPGQSISIGDPLLILEAMKMENVLKATGEGMVKSIEVNKKVAVEKGELLIKME